jgi:hypothetical protein
VPSIAQVRQEIVDPDRGRRAQGDRKALWLGTVPGDLKGPVAIEAIAQGFKRWT